MRKLKTRDIPAACRCLKSLGIKDDIRELAQNSNSIKDAWGRGFEFMWHIFDLATESAGESQLYSFLAGPFEMTAEEVADMEIPELVANLKQLCGENDLGSFFKNAGALMK